MIQAENDSPHPRSLTHDEGAGKTGVIQSVIVNEVGHAKVRAAMDGGEVFLLNAYGYGAPVFDGIVFLRDIDDARKSFLGKHLWTNGNYIYTLDGEDETSLLEVRRFSRLKVVDVVAGWSAEEPIRFVLETDDGREGFLDTRTSERNSPGLDGRRNEFARKLLTSDPKSANKWPDDIWLLIERGQIENGMTRDQVLMSRGAPDEVNETRIGDAVHEQWVYGDDLFIYLENDVVTALQQ